MTADEIRELLGLIPLPGEGGYYAETYRSPHTLFEGPPAAGPEAPRSLATAIFYLLTSDSFSALHRLPGDEVYHFYRGDPVDLLRLPPGGGGDVVRMGGALDRGEIPQALVPGGVWQGARLVPGGEWALLGTTMAPGFDFADFEAGDPEDLSRRYPELERHIHALAR